MFLKINTTQLSLFLILTEIYLLPDRGSTNTIFLITWLIISLIIHKGDVLGKFGLLGFSLAFFQLLLGDSIHAEKTGIWIFLIFISSTVYNLREKKYI